MAAVSLDIPMAILIYTIFMLFLLEYLAVEDFPEHIKILVQKEKESEEQEKRQREIERNTCKVRCPVALLKCHSYICCEVKTR